YPGDPVSGTGWVSLSGADRQFLMSSGPFSLPAGTAQDVVLAIIVAQGVDRLDSVDRLRLFDGTVQTAFNSGTIGLLGVPGRMGGRLVLDRVYPNPVRSALNVRFVLPADGDAGIELLDLAGRRVLERALGSPGAGPHTVSLAGATGSLAPGVYFLRLTQGSEAVTRRVAVSR